MNHLRLVYAMLALAGIASLSSFGCKSVSPGTDQPVPSAHNPSAAAPTPSAYQVPVQLKLEAKEFVAVGKDLVSSASLLPNGDMVFVRSKSGGEPGATGELWQFKASDKSLTRIATSSLPQGRITSAVSTGDWIVWMDVSPSRWQMRAMSSRAAAAFTVVSSSDPGRQLFAPYNQPHPAIDGDVVYWEEVRGPGDNVFSFDLAARKEQQLIDTRRAGGPAPSKGYLVYPQFTSDERKEVEIRLRDLKSGGDRTLLPPGVAKGFYSFSYPNFAYIDDQQTVRVLNVISGKSEAVSEASKVQYDTFHVMITPNYVTWTNVPYKEVHLVELASGAVIVVTPQFADVEVYWPQVSDKRVMFIGVKGGETRLFYADLP